MDCIELPEPDGYFTDDDVRIPQWKNVTLVGTFVEVWPDGVNSEVFDFMDALDITPSDVERSGRILFAVAAQMRTHDAWKDSP
jgi:hypothetical protein